MVKIIFITGTDTGAGKTVLTGLLLAHLRGTGVHALAIKPFCTGSRADAELLFELQDREVPIEIVNPFYFKQPVAPLTAARAVRRQISLKEVLASIHSLKAQCDVLLVEGAGGLLVPLGKQFMIVDIVRALRCPVLVTAQNKLGVINHSLLTVRVLGDLGIWSMVVLMGVKDGDASSRFNDKILAEFLSKSHVTSLPFLRGNLRLPSIIRVHAKRRKNLLAWIAERSNFRFVFRAVTTKQESATHSLSTNCR